MVIFPLSPDKNPAVPIGTDWKKYTGKADTPLVGVMIPKGAIVIDVDEYKGVDTGEIDIVLGCCLDWQSAELQSTLKGGKHYLFRVPDDVEMINSTNLMGVEGFDTRSAGKGYIATGRGYENLTFFDSVIEALENLTHFPWLPTQVIEKLKHTQVEESDLMSLVAAEPLDLSYDEVSAYVDLLPYECCEDHDTWLHVGMAIYHQLGNDGWDLFDSFSRRCSDKYNAKKNLARWQSFARKQHSNPRTFATIIELAGGAIARTQVTTQIVNKGIEEAETLDDIKAELQRLANVRIDNLALDVALKAIQTKYKDILGKSPSLSAIRKEIKRLRGDDNSGDFVENYVYMTATAEYMDRETKAVMKREAFNTKHNRDTPLNSDGEKQTAVQFTEDKIETVENSMYFPAADDIFSKDGLTYVNTYTAPNISKVAVGTTDIIHKFNAHLKHLLPDERERDIVVNYLAHNVQFPGVKIPWSIVLQGVQGDGKSFIAELMQHVLGFNNVRIMNVQTLESSFTGWATGQCMTFIEELKLDNFRKYEVLNNLKPYISNPVVEEHKKGKEPRSVVNTTNYFALTNFKDAIPIDSSDRRYCILFSQWQTKEKLIKWMADNPNYYPNLYESMRLNYPEIRQYLLEYCLADWFLDCKRAPDTNAKNMMQELSKSPSLIAVEDALEEFADKITCEDGELDVTQLGKIIKEQSEFSSKYDDFPKTIALKNVLLNMGYEAVGRKRSIYSDGDNKHYLYRR